jgi:hypothetical protein
MLFSASHLDDCISNFLADRGVTTGLWEPSYVDEWHSEISLDKALRDIVLML